MPLCIKSKSIHSPDGKHARDTNRKCCEQTQAGKQPSNPPCTALMKGCPTGTSTIPPFCLNATPLSPNSFILSLTSALTRGPFQALLDSGSSHSFVDEIFAQCNKFTLVYLTEPIPLQLFDGSSMTSVVCKTRVPITMPTGETHEVEFFIMKLDKGYSVVLGYDWLVQHNLAIDWIETKVILRKPLVTPKNNITAPTKINIC